MGYCVKCKRRVIIKNPQTVTLKNGRTAIKGECPNCKTALYVFAKVVAS